MSGRKIVGWKSGARLQKRKQYVRYRTPIYAEEEEEEEEEVVEVPAPKMTSVAQLVDGKQYARAVVSSLGQKCIEKRKERVRSMIDPDERFERLRVMREVERQEERKKRSVKIDVDLLQQFINNMRSQIEQFQQQVNKLKEEDEDN